MKIKKTKLKLLDILTSIVILTYAIIRIFFVHFFFPNKVKFDNIAYCFNEYSQYKKSTVTENEILSFLDEISDIIKTNPFYDEKMKINICFCKNRAQYSFWNPLTAFKGSLAVSTNFLSSHNIMISEPDFLTYEVSFTNKRFSNTRRIPDIINHEMTHSFLRNKLNFFSRIKKLPKWKEEGIAEIVANSSSYDIETGIKLFLNNNKDNNPAFNYFKYRLCIIYLLKEKNMSLSQIIDSPLKYSDIQKEILQFEYDEIFKWFE